MSSKPNILTNLDILRLYETVMGLSHLFSVSLTNLTSNLPWIVRKHSFKNLSNPVFDLILYFFLLPYIKVYELSDLFILMSL